MIVAKGTLTGADEGTASAAAGHIVNITWSDNSGTGDALATDNAMALLINPTKKTIMQDTTTKTRADGSLQLTVPSKWVGDLVHAYLSFKTPTGDKVADSIFLASITIVA